MSNPGAEQLQALITYANEITGGSDTKISDAVATLASGYGSGSGLTPTYSVTLDSDLSNVPEIKAIIDEYVPLIYIGHAYLVQITGNTSSSDYAGYGAFWYKMNDGIAYKLYFRKAKATDVDTNSNYSFAVTAGSVVDIYDITLF